MVIYYVYLFVLTDYTIPQYMYYYGTGIVLPVPLAGMGDKWISPVDCHVRGEAEGVDWKVYRYTG